MGKLIDVIKMVADPMENQINMQNCMLSNYNTKLLLTVYFNKYIFYSTLCLIYHIRKFLLHISCNFVNNSLPLTELTHLREFNKLWIFTPGTVSTLY